MNKDPVIVTSGEQLIAVFGKPNTKPEQYNYNVGGIQDAIMTTQRVADSDAELEPESLNYNATSTIKATMTDRTNIDNDECPLESEEDHFDRYNDPDLERDYESLAKRLLGAMYYGFAIEPYAGHRYIAINKNADNLPQSIKQRFFDGPNADHSTYVIKEYGSVLAALDTIDSFLTEADVPVTQRAYEYYCTYSCDSAVFGRANVE